jgi:hypothetical protein
MVDGLICHFLVGLPNPTESCRAKTQQRIDEINGLSSDETNYQPIKKSIKPNKQSFKVLLGKKFGTFGSIIWDKDLLKWEW